MIYEDRKVTRLEKKAKRTQGTVFGPQSVDASILEVLPYEYPKSQITTKLTTDEFTCLCPYSGLPDFAHIEIQYVPKKHLIELKSLKYYLYAFRNVKIYNEHAVNKILIDLKKALKPYRISVEAEFTSRGGIVNKVLAKYP